ncbi:MAG: polyamine ABC transporter substrate-binding protein [Pseudomonadota bacterium]
MSFFISSTIGRLAIAAAATAALTASTHAQERVVNVYNWSDYIDEEVLEDFTAETGIRVVYDVFDTNELLETKLLSGASGYDVVVPSAEFLARQIQAGVFQELDKSQLSNIGNMWDKIEQKLEPYDPGNAYSVNYMWGTTGIGYNVDKVTERLGDDAPVDSWALVFDPANMEKLADCGVHFLDAPSEMIPAALNYLGLNPGSTDQAELEQAADLLLAVRPYVQKFHSSEYVQALANGDICIAIGFSGDIFQSVAAAEEADNGVVVAYSIPSQGAQLWFDQMAIPADAPNAAEAYEFINFMMKPEAIAKATNYVYYANGNKASQELLEEDLIKDPTIYPDAETEAKLFTKVPYDLRTQRVVTRLWQRVTTGS